jgi:hypothetical protein
LKFVAGEMSEGVSVLSVTSMVLGRLLAGSWQIMEHLGSNFAIVVKLLQTS